MARKEILISGFGGQGVVKAGRALGYAAVLAGLNASMLVSHGTETRGGYVRSQVVVADEAIDNPAVEHADVFCALSQAAYGRFLHLAEKGVVLYDPGFVTPTAVGCTAHVAVPARDIAAAQTGDAVAANMVALGVILQKLGIVPLASALRAVREILPRHAEASARALEIGYEFK